MNTTYETITLRLPKETIEKLAAERIEQQRQGIADATLSSIANDCIEGWLGL